MKGFGVKDTKAAFRKSRIPRTRRSPSQESQSPPSSSDGCSMVMEETSPLPSPVRVHLPIYQPLSPEKKWLRFPTFQISHAESLLSRIWWNYTEKEFCVSDTGKDFEWLRRGLAWTSMSHTSCGWIRTWFPDSWSCFKSQIWCYQSTDGYYSW